MRNILQPPYGFARKINGILIIAFILLSQILSAQTVIDKIVEEENTNSQLQK